MTSASPHIYLYKRVVQAKLFIDEHYHEHIDLRNIADEACFSKFHFARLFKQIYGYTPHQYLTRVRIEKAKELLEQSTTVTATCSLVGFESISSFTGLFKKTVKLSPSRYQETVLQRKKEIKNSPLLFIPNCFAEQKGWVKTKKSNFEEAI
jgi:AraC-like DNA-binding protein